MSFLSQPLSLISIKPRRKLGSIEVNVIIDEATNDSLTITKAPVQQGASITDHAFKNPTSLVMRALFNDNIGLSLSKVYQNLLDLQQSRVPFDVITPKRIYRNVLLEVLGNTTDKKTENVLAVSMTFQEIIIVKISTTQVPRNRQRNAARTGKTEDAGKKSALLTAKEGIGKLFGQ